MKKYLILKKEHEEKQYNPMEQIFLGFDKERHIFIFTNAYETESVQMFFEKEFAEELIKNSNWEGKYIISSVIWEREEEIEKNNMEQEEIY